MPLLVDTYNVLHVVGILPPEEAGIDVEGLVRLLKLSRYRHERIDLVCDGVPGLSAPRSKGGIRVCYAGPGVQADDVIIQQIRRSTSPKRLTVISSDQEIVRAAKKRRCRTLSSNAFMQQLADDLARVASVAPKTSTTTPEPGHKLDAWLRFFKLNPRELEQIETEEPRPTESTPRERDEPPTASQQDAEQDQRERDGPILPPDVIEEADRLWQASKPRPRRSAPENDSTGT